jgi:apolipoprotein N-acyltransferase
MRVAGVLLGGVLYALALPPFDWSICGWLALAPLILAIRSQGLATAFRYGCLFGYVSGWSVLWPLVQASAAYLQVSDAIAVPAVALWFLIVVGVPFGVFGAAASLVVTHSRRWYDPLLVAALWVASELLRGRLFAQPWGLLGYTQHLQTDLVQISAVTGVYGVSFLLAAMSGVVAEGVWLLRKRGWPSHLAARAAVPTMWSTGRTWCDN